MLIIGAQGHASEVWCIIKKNYIKEEWFFFDNVTRYSHPKLFGNPILDNYDDVKQIFSRNNRFILAMGGTKVRCDLVHKLQILGGVLESVISDSAFISDQATINNGVNIMPFSSVFGNALIGEGVLLNAYASVHHDSRVGKYSEISPGARILGNCRIGEMCSIGTNAVILPKVRIADHIIIGAGAVVTKDLSQPGIYCGIPAKKMERSYG